MLLSLTLVAADFEKMQEVVPAALEALAGAALTVKASEPLGEAAMDIFVEGEDLSALRVQVRGSLARQRVDFCLQKAEGRRKRLLLADMDSTIIGCECLDELADFAGLRAEISAVTARAMAGEIAFEAALTERVARLAGLELTALEAAFSERVRLNAGARTLAATMAAHGARCVLVSGGFDFFTSKVAAAAGFHAHRANRLLDDGARLTGEVAQPILGAEAKLATLMEETQAMGIGLGETAAVGDGANDLAIIRAAGLGVAYHGKPILAEAADAAILHTDLASLLYFQGYGAEAFVR